MAEAQQNGENGDVPEEKEEPQKGKDLEKTDGDGKVKEEPEEKTVNGKSGENLSRGLAECQSMSS